MNSNNSRTQELTFGAMLIAVFGVILVMNRQTAGLFEELIFFILPIPITIFTIKYGRRDSLSVFVCMAMLSFFLGTLYTAFFATTEAFLGIVLGDCIRRNVNLNRTQMLIMGLSAVFNVLGTIVLASLFGLDLNTQLQETQDMLNSMFTRAGMGAALQSEAAASVISIASLKRMYILSMTLLGIIQGFVIVRLCLVVLKKLRLPVPQPQPIGQYYPPRWSGFLALILFIIYFYSMTHPSPNETVQNILQTAGLCGYLYLLCFGWIAMTLLLRRMVSGKAARVLCAVGALFLLMILPYMFLILGVMYICTNFHTNLLMR